MQGKYPKILLLAGWYPNLLCEGEGDFIRYQAQLMHKHGINISVFHANLSYKYLFKGIRTKQITQEENIINEYVIEGPFLPRNSKLTMSLWGKSFLKEVLKYMEKYGQPDLIHAHTYLGGYISSLIREKLDIPYILTLHETSFITGKIPPYHQDIVKRALENASHVVAVSSELGKTVDHAFGIKSIVIPNFIDFNKFVIADSKHKKFTFIYVGDLIRRKNVTALIEAFSIVKSAYTQVQLVIIGDGNEEKKLRKKSVDLNISNHVLFVGRLSQEAVAKELSVAHCFVLPSSVETFGIVLVEAMACGLSVISTSSGGPSDIVSSDIGRLLDSNDPITISKAMVEAYKNSGKNKSAEVRAFARVRFSAEVITPKYERIYRGILE